MTCRKFDKHGETGRMSDRGEYSDIRRDGYDAAGDG
jgi:hypothetical protein